MTSTESSVRAQPPVADIEGAIALAARAPSIHDTQPWRFVLTADTLELWADRSREPAVGDVDGGALDGRALLVACGGALHLAGLGLAAVGWRTMTERLPDPDQPDLLARIRFIGRRTANQRVREMAAAAALRRTELRPFGPGPVAPELLSGLCATVADPGVYVHCVRRADERLDLAEAASWADGLLAGDEAGRAEPARWERPDAAAAGDGVPATAVPAADRPRPAELPVRDVEVGAEGGPDPVAEGDGQPAFLVVFSRDDTPASRLRAGETHAQLSVRVQQLGLASSAMIRALDVPGVRDRLRVLMSWPDHPQMILRVGWPPSGDEAPPPARPPVATVLTVTRPDGPS